MNIYFSGIGGVGIGPLAEIAKSAGYGVFGSDLLSSPLSKNLEKENIEIEYGKQNGDFLKEKFIENGIDWFVHTAALPKDHPEIITAKNLGIKITKRDELLNEIIQQKDLNLIAVSGTHGKTTTTGMMIWVMQQLGIPISWSVGTTLSFGKSGFYDKESKFFIYEADEFDRNFLHFSPYVSLITSIDYDHTDTYKTKADYLKAFTDFSEQSDFIISWKYQHAEIFEKINNKILLPKANNSLTLYGAHNRRNASLVLEAISYLVEAQGFDFGEKYFEKTIEALNNFPGTDRRFERIAEGIFSDYGHTPIEIQCTLELANEVVKDTGFSGISLVYQPHQNIRQHEVKEDYSSELFSDVNEVLWLPTYLSRENPNLEILTPSELSKNISSKTEILEMNENLIARISELRSKNRLILLMSAGTLDGFIRKKLKS